MKIKNILCPIDFSPSSDQALKFATSLAKQHNAELHIVYSYEEPYTYQEGRIGGVVTPVEMASDRQRLDAITPPSADILFRRQLLIGRPQDTILAYAEEENIDLIVMGTHGRTGLGRLLMGSVAETIVRCATCPVLTIKMPLKSADCRDSDAAKGAV